MARTVRVKGLKQFLKRIKDAPKEAQRGLTRSVTRAVLNVERRAKRLAPVDTGRLRASIRAEIDENQLSGEVFTDVFYAPFLEFGTSKQPPQPFLFPAWEAERRDLLDRMAKVMQGAT